MHCPLPGHRNTVNHSGHLVIGYMEEFVHLRFERIIIFLVVIAEGKNCNASSKVQVFFLIPVIKIYTIPTFQHDRITPIDPADKSSLISVLTLPAADKLIGEGFIGGGMLPKNHCFESILPPDLLVLKNPRWSLGFCCF